MTQSQELVIDLDKAKGYLISKVDNLLTESNGKGWKLLSSIITLSSSFLVGTIVIAGKVFFDVNNEISFYEHISPTISKYLIAGWVLFFISTISGIFAIGDLTWQTLFDI